MRIVLGNDHAGYLAKTAVKNYLLENKYDVIDVGCDSPVSCNYATFGINAAEVVAKHDADFGILICGTGEGISIAANKAKGIRCGIGYNDEVTALIRQHNNCNMVAFGARFMDVKDILHRVEIFLNTEFEAGRHEVRVNYIKDFEEK